MLPSVDVVVCTRNRADQLARSLEAILRQDYPVERWCLLVVDNASTDGTWEVARSVAERHPRRVRAVSSPAIGHSRARNTGATEARGEIVAFTDDDALPDAGWLRSLVDAMASTGAQAAGGPVDAARAGLVPHWFLPDYVPYLAVWRLGGEIRELSYNLYPRGVNLAFRRDCFARCGLFSPALGLGQPGRIQHYCEELEMCLRVERLGGKVVYAPAGRVLHEIDTARLTTDWLWRRFAAQGRSEAVVNWMHGGLRGLLLGSRVHFANLRALPAAWVSTRLEQDMPGFIRDAASGSRTELGEVVRIWSLCRRQALRGYLRQAPRAVLSVPRYRPPAGAAIRPWDPLRGVTGSSPSAWASA